MTAYLETSFLVSLYTLDANSASASAAVLLVPGPFPLTSFGELEFANALELRVFRREITPARAKLVLSGMAADIESGVFHSITMPVSVYEEGLRLVRGYSAALGTRTLDILHIASALKLGLRAFYTFDRRQAELARAVGLTTPIRIR